MIDEMKPRFELGQVVATPGAIETLEEAGVSAAELLHRHVRGDWGDLDAEDKEANEEALRHGGRILSAYVLPSTDEKVWIITEADRSSTCCLRPDEY